MTDHKDTWAAPPAGWPTFDEEGRIIRNDKEETEEILDESIL